MSDFASLDQRIDTAMSRLDRETLRAALAEDFIYTHSNGRSQPKDEFMAGVLQRSEPPDRLLSDVHGEEHGDVLVTRGNLDIQYHDDRPNLYMRYVRVYRRAGDGWLAFSHRTLYATDRKPE
jgi:hypothetical protein